MDEKVNNIRELWAAGVVQDRNDRNSISRPWSGARGADGDRLRRAWAGELGAGELASVRGTEQEKKAAIRVPLQHRATDGKRSHIRGLRSAGSVQDRKAGFHLPAPVEGSLARRSPGGAHLLGPHRRCTRSKGSGSNDFRHRQATRQADRSSEIGRRTRSQPPAGPVPGGT